MSSVFQAFIFAFFLSVDMEGSHSSPPPTSVSSPNSSLHHDERVRLSSPASSNPAVEVGQDLTSRNEVGQYSLWTIVNSICLILNLLCLESTRKFSSSIHVIEDKKQKKKKQKILLVAHKKIPPSNNYHLIFTTIPTQLLGLAKKFCCSYIVILSYFSVLEIQIFKGYW